MLAIQTIVRNETLQGVLNISVRLENEVKYGNAEILRRFLLNPGTSVWNLGRFAPERADSVLKFLRAGPEIRRAGKLVWEEMTPK